MHRAALLKAVAEREAAIKRLEKELKRAEAKPTGQTLPDLHVWVEQQLQNLTEVLKTDAAKTKAEFRRLNLQLTFSPVEAKPRAHYIVLASATCAHWPFLFALQQVRFWIGRWSVRSTGAPQFYGDFRSGFRRLRPEGGGRSAGGWRGDRGRRWQPFELPRNLRSDRFGRGIACVMASI